MGERGRDFLIKRAPFYLAGAALLIVFVVPPMLEEDLEDIMPSMQEEREEEILRQVLGYTGPNDTGIDIMDAISSKIESTYPDADVYGHRSTTLQVGVMATSMDTYRVTLEFESRGDRLYYDWEVNVAEGGIIGNNDISKDALDMVNFYD